MGRPLRIEFDGALYHVMNRGVNRQDIFLNEEHRYEFLNILSKTRLIYGIEIYGYCLMSNHYHLIIRTPRGNISNSIRYLNSNYAKYVNKTLNRDGPLFRGRFKAIVIGEDDYLARLSRYIHLNPLKAKMIASLSDYPWSSYPVYIGNKIAPDWLCTTEIMLQFGAKNFYESYKKFVENDSDDEMENFYKDNRVDPVIGGIGFRRKIDDYVKLQGVSPEVNGANRIFVPPAISSIITAVAQHFGSDPKQISQAHILMDNVARRIAIYICRELGGYQLKVIGEVMGGVSYKTISSAIRRVKLDQTQLKVAHFLMDQLRRCG